MRHAPFVVVLGLHRSGSSCVAMMCHKLGVLMGREFNGFEDWEGTKSGSGEAVTLREICDDALPFPGLEFEINTAQRVGRLRRWVRGIKRDAQRRGTIAGAKYPQLALMYGEMRTAASPGHLHVVICNREFEDSVSSMQQRCAGKHDPKQIRRHQTKLRVGIAEWRKRCSTVLELEYADVLARPDNAAKTLAAFLPMHIRPEKVKLAADHVISRGPEVWGPERAEKECEVI